ncbi:hypothetical protein ACFE04_009245 [Oxalis oulophora]
MSEEPKDPAIKLFGKTIPVADNNSYSISDYSGVESDDDDDVSNRDRTDSANSESVENKEKLDKDPSEGMHEEESTNPESGTRNNTITSNEKESSSVKEDGQCETSNSQDKTLKKPDKIIPCPRCNSMETKFCYYNNYNVNQPRHFCKKCQRYWTAGGTMRNVPVGAGRRKNKNLSSHYRHITVSEALQSDINHPSMNPNNSVLTFSSNAPLCESVASVLNIADKARPVNGFHKPDKLIIPVSYRADVPTIGSSTTNSNSKDDVSVATAKDSAIPTCQGFPPHIPYFPGAPWPFPQWSSPMPPPVFCPPGFMMPFYPAAPYWSCPVPGAWNMPLVPQLTSPNPSITSSSPLSPTLGKHSRDENRGDKEEESQVERKSEKSLWIPKTLRIDDPRDAAKSSIWTTLGISKDKPDSVCGGGHFKAFQPRRDEKNHMAETSPVLHANPAALSRSLNFHESS